MDLWLLRLGGRARHKEQSAECEPEDLLPRGFSNPKSKIEYPKWLHLITLSARAKTCGGMVNPICFAVLRLITSSTFVGCSTGKSVSFVRGLTKTAPAFNLQT